jgi:hypothetical protein
MDSIKLFLIKILLTIPALCIGVYNAIRVFLLPVVDLWRNYDN